jgi:hypothetical protein
MKHRIHEKQIDQALTVGHVVGRSASTDTRQTLVHEWTGH